MVIENDEKGISPSLVIVALAVIMLAAPPIIYANILLSKNWSDGTICRLVGENHGVENTALYAEEASRRGIYCIKKQVVSKAEAIRLGLVKTSSEGLGNPVKIYTDSTQSVIKPETSSSTEPAASIVRLAASREDATSRVDQPKMLTSDDGQVHVSKADIEVLRRQLEVLVAQEVKIYEGVANSSEHNVEQKVSPDMHPRSNRNTQTIDYETDTDWNGVNYFGYVQLG
jgi:hypothetical protein